MENFETMSSELLMKHFRSVIEADIAGYSKYLKNEPGITFKMKQAADQIVSGLTKLEAEIIAAFKSQDDGEPNVVDMTDLEGGDI